MQWKKSRQRKRRSQRKRRPCNNRNKRGRLATRKTYWWWTTTRFNFKYWILLWPRVDSRTTMQMEAKVDSKSTRQGSAHLLTAWRSWISLQREMRLANTWVTISCSKSYKETFCLLRGSSYRTMRCQKSRGLPCAHLSGITSKLLLQS